MHRTCGGPARAIEPPKTTVTVELMTKPQHLLQLVHPWGAEPEDQNRFLRAQLLTLVVVRSRAEKEGEGDTSIAQRLASKVFLMPHVVHRCLPRANEVARRRAPEEIAQDGGEAPHRGHEEMLKARKNGSSEWRVDSTRAPQVWWCITFFCLTFLLIYRGL